MEIIHTFFTDGQMFVAKYYILRKVTSPCLLYLVDLLVIN